MATGLQSIGFLLTSSSVEMEALAKRLAERFERAEVQHRGEKVRMLWGDWGITITHLADEMVFEECREMAACHPDDPLWQQVGDSVGRLDVCADPDPEDRYYNEWLVVSEYLSEMVRVLVYDPMLGEWLGNASPD